MAKVLIALAVFGAAGVVGGALWQRSAHQAGPVYSGPAVLAAAQATGGTQVDPQGADMMSAAAPVSFAFATGTNRGSLAVWASGAQAAQLLDACHQVAGANCGLLWRQGNVTVSWDLVPTSSDTYDVQQWLR